ncbi:MAG: hypothetical protein M5U29_09590 [Anaerolineae bacterium]|nr:hypothetical protein [Anaerolineae bacterium]
MAVTFTVEMDWSADGTWTDETARVRRVRARAGFARAREPVAAPGVCELVLDNHDRRFSPGNAASPLAGKLLPGRAARLCASEGGDTWTLFCGTIARIAPEAGAWPGAVTITCTDGIARLARARVSVPHTDAVPAAEAVSDLVSAVYTPPALSIADNGDSLAHYGRSWEPERVTALDALEDICRAVYGRFWVARDGTVTFWSRCQQQDPSVSAALVSGTGASAAPLDALDVTLDAESVINHAQVTVYPVETVGSLQVLWTARTVLRVAPGQTRTLYAPFHDENGARVGALDVLAPVATTDYAVNDRADGSGYDYTGSPHFALSAAIEATRVAITLTNTAIGPLYVTRLQVRGKPIRVYDPITLDAGDASSQASFEERSLALDLPMQPDPVFGQAYAEYLVGRFKTPALAATRLRVRDRARLGGASVFGVGLMDKVVVSDAASGLSAAAHWVCAAEYELATGGFTVTLHLERADERRYALLDRAGYAELGSTTRLGL